MHAQTGRSRSGVALALTIAILLPILYVLSVGPAVMFVRMTNTEDELGPAFEVLYFPVIWLHEYTALREPLEVYVELWAP